MSLLNVLLLLFPFLFFFAHPPTLPPEEKKNHQSRKTNRASSCASVSRFHEIYDGCGPPSDPDKATKGRRSSFSPHSPSSSHSSKHGHLPLFCLHPPRFWLVC